ncbi:MAG: hypothetical protein C0403_14780 [Desulfobacterium sp.]|nr:hypothetical protein [Desulfobacterium sp.]
MTLLFLSFVSDIAIFSVTVIFDGFLSYRVLKHNAYQSHIAEQATVERSSMLFSNGFDFEYDDQ